jgi:hypothetical protein
MTDCVEEAGVWAEGGNRMATAGLSKRTQRFPDHARRTGVVPGSPSAENGPIADRALGNGSFRVDDTMPEGRFRIASQTTGSIL